MDIISLNTTAPSMVYRDYYRCVLADRYHTVGDYVRVTLVANDTVHFLRRDSGYTATIDAFLEHFIHDPAGATQAQIEITTLLTAIADDTRSIEDMTVQIAQLTPHLSAGVLHVGGTDTVSALVPIGITTPTDLKRALAKVQHLARERQATLAAKQAEVQALMAEQLGIVNAIMRPLEAMVKRLQEGIWTINLYLGRDEQIELIRDGTPAPAATPLTLRQLVLAMDEECVVAPESGGIDANSLESFDRWLLADPRNVAQIIPEGKAIVVLTPRGDAPKNYGDRWVNAQMNEENKRSYWLIRNGECLYRMVTSIDVGRTLVPTRDAFLSFFTERRYNPATRDYDQVPIEPGSQAYMRAEEQADAHNRHYMRIALVIQGLVDRTPILHPLPPGGIPITRPEVFDEGKVRIVADAERLLTDGHERFNDWLKRLNGELTTGMRILGVFHTYHGFDDVRKQRLSISSDQGPSSFTPYVLEGKRDDGFFFRYERDGYGWRAYERRASCVVLPSDHFILPFDLITVEECHYFLANRLDRRAYLDMVPLLKAAIVLKQQEDAQEAPFRLLLIGEIVKHHQVDHETAATELDELVRGYKYHNKTHRPLVGDDDGKALRMIIASFGLVLRERANRAVREQRGEFARVHAQILAAYPDVLLIAHKAEAEYVALLPANDDCIFVHELVITARGVVRERRDWRTVDMRFKRWRLIFTAARWVTWSIGANRFAYLTDPEIQTVGAHLITRAHTLMTVSTDVGEGTLLAVTFERDEQFFRVYFVRSSVAIPAADRILSGTLTKATVQMVAYLWTRDVTHAVVLDAKATYQLGNTIEWPAAGAPWDAGQYRTHHSEYGASWGRSSTLRHRPEVMLFHDTAACAAVVADQVAYDAAKRLHDSGKDQIHRIHKNLEQQWLARIEQQAYTRFIDEYADPALWEGHRKTIKLPVYGFWHHRLFNRVLSYFIERGAIDMIDGTTVAALCDGFIAEADTAWTPGNAEQWPDTLDDLVIHVSKKERC